MLGNLYVQILYLSLAWYEINGGMCTFGYFLEELCGNCKLVGRGMTNSPFVIFGGCHRR